MKLIGISFQDGSDIPNLYSIDGENIMPAFRIQDVPENASSLVLIMEDLDSPIGILTHLLIWNIPPDTTTLDNDHIPDHAQWGMNSFGEVGYRGPCPPSGRHQYRFCLLALESVLDCKTADRKHHVEEEMANITIAQSILFGYFETQP